MNAYTFDTNLDFNEIGRDGYGTVRCKVLGYWSSDSITMYVRREFDKQWCVTLSHSSGGRDTKEVASHLNAEINFARALIAMAEFGKTVEAHFGELEAAYEARRVELNREWEAERAAKQAKIDADEALGFMEAERLIALMAQGKPVKVYARGQDRAIPASCSIRGNTSYYYAGNRTAKKEMIELLAKASNRTSIAS